MQVLLAFGAVLVAAAATGGEGAAPAAPVKSSKPPRLSVDQVREAIQWGATATDNELQQYVLKTEPTWMVNFDTPYLRVAQLSHAWKKQGRRIKDTDVPPGVIEPQVHVYALARQQPGVTEKVKSLRHLTIRTPGAHEWVQPSSVQTNLSRTRNRNDFSPAKIARSVQASFSVRDFSAGNELRVEFEDGTSERVVLSRDILAKAR
jgi:hypothetical protein